MKASNAILQAQAPVVAPPAPALAPAPIALSERPFFGVENHKHITLKTEQPHHRAITILLAQGYTPSEVADKTGFSTTMVQYVWKQPWAQKLIAELQGEVAKKAVMNELNGAALDAARLITRSVRSAIPGTGVVMEGHKASDACKDAHKLLDRLYGTAPQTVTVHHSKEDMEQLSTEELENIARGNTN